MLGVPFLLLRAAEPVASGSMAGSASSCGENLSTNFSGHVARMTSRYKEKRGPQRAPSFARPVTRQDSALKEILSSPTAVPVDPATTVPSVSGVKPDPKTITGPVEPVQPPQRAMKMRALPFVGR